MSKNALQCTRCQKVWTRQTLLDDACPECKGEIRDITHTARGQEFLSIIGMPSEIRLSKDQHNIYPTGPSFIFPGDQS